MTRWPRPVQALVLAAFLGAGPASAQIPLAQYGELREKYRDQAAYDFSMRTLNMLAEKLAGEKSLDSAIKVQEFNVKVNPGIASSHRLLADLYLDKGDRAAARANFEKAVALAPEDASYKRRLQEMSASPSPR